MAFRSLLSRLFLLCGLLAGCGGSAQTVTIRTDGMRFVADEARVRAGEPVTLRVVNRDDYAHAFDIDEFDIHRPLAAKEIAEITLSPEQAGSYRFYCGSPGHAQAGWRACWWWSRKWRFQNRAGGGKMREPFPFRPDALHPRGYFYGNQPTDFPDNRRRPDCLSHSG